MKKRYGPFLLYEWIVLDLLYIVGLIAYVIVQLIMNGEVKDFVFILLLSCATIFINYRQQNLYISLYCEEAIAFFKSIGINADEQVDRIFLRRTQRLFAVLYALLFSAVIWSFDVGDGCLPLNIAFSFFLFTANIPTGFGICRIFLYFLSNNTWISKIDYENNYRRSEQFVKKICYKVLFTAAVYCTTSLISVIFTSIKIDSIVLGYTVFALLLTVMSLLSTNLMIYKVRRNRKLEVIDLIDAKKREYVEQVINGNFELVQNVKILNKIRKDVLEETNGGLDVSKVFSSIGLFVITVLPIILKWVLERYK